MLKNDYFVVCESGVLDISTRWYKASLFAPQSQSVSFLDQLFGTYRYLLIMKGATIVSALGAILLWSCNTSASNARHHRPHGHHQRAAWPDTPFTVTGRDMISASGVKVVYAGANWPGAADTMLPEGLQYNSISNIVGFIKSLGMNVVRLTYAIEMIDDYYSDSPNQSLQATLTNALGDSNGSAVLQEILKHNPQFSAQTTRLEARSGSATVRLFADCHNPGFRCRCCRVGSSANLDPS